MNSGIYQILNIKNGKSYIGSAKNFNVRWKRHLKDLSKGVHSSIKLQRSFDKHGIESFKFNIIDIIPYEKSIIIDKENYYITHFNSKQNGYNIADAAFGDTWTACPNKEERSKKLSESAINYYSTLTPEERKKKHGSPNKLKGKRLGDIYTEEKANAIGEKIRVSNLNRKMKGEGNPMFGKTLSAEARLKISISQKGTKKPRRTVIINGVQYDTVAEAVRQTGITRKMIMKQFIN